MKAQSGKTGGKVTGKRATKAAMNNMLTSSMKGAKRVYGKAYVGGPATGKGTAANKRPKKK